MKQTVFKFAMAVLFLLPLTASDIFAQAEDGEEYSRWGISLYGGYTFPETDDGLQIFGSSFNVVTESSWNFGGGVHYNITPLWTVEGGYRYNTIEGSGFETTMHTASLKNRLNLDRLFRRSSASDFLNPFVLIGFEQDFFTVDTADDQFSRNESSLIAGAGLAIKLTNRFDIFGQYEFKVASNRLDNANQGFPYDQIGMASGGIRINLSRNGSEPARRAPATRKLTDAQHAHLMNQSRAYDETERKVARQEEKLSELEAGLRDADQNHQEQVAQLEGRVSSLEERMYLLESKVDSLKEAQPEVPQPEMRATVEAGHYIQVFAATGSHSASIVRDQFIDILDSELENAEDQVFVIKRGQYYEVLIGKFSSFANADSMNGKVTDHHSDAFVISFPRPLHLEDQYRGTEIVYDI